MKGVKDTTVASTRQKPLLPLFLLEELWHLFSDSFYYFYCLVFLKEFPFFLFGFWIFQKIVDIFSTQTYWYEQSVIYFINGSFRSVLPGFICA